MELWGVLYVRCADTEGRDRLRFYLDAATRPDFADEVPEEEADLVSVFERIDDPEELLEPSPTELIASFDMLSGDPRHALAGVLNRFHTAQALWYESDGGEVDVYYCYRNDAFHFLYSPTPLDDPDDDVRYNRNLPVAVQKGMKAAGKNGMEAVMLFLAKNHSKCPR